MDGNGKTGGQKADAAGWRIGSYRIREAGGRLEIIAALV
jgi:hypothetical protein